VAGKCARNRIGVQRIAAHDRQPGARTAAAAASVPELLRRADERRDLMPPHSSEIENLGSGSAICADHEQLHTHKTGQGAIL
jgi:hypothetical protein